MVSEKIAYCEKIPYWSYLILVLILYFAMEFSTFPESLDIGRYYSNVENATKSYDNLIAFIKNTISVNKDFIYFTSLFIALKVGVSLNIVTTMYLSMYYICCCELIRRSIGLKRISKFILFYSLMCAPFIWVQEISRNLAAIAILYLSIMKFQGGENKKAIIFMIASVFSHISMIIYVIIVLVSVFLAKKNIKMKHRMLSVLFLSLIVIGMIIPNTIVSFMSLLAAVTDSRYVAYSVMENTQPLLTNTISYGDKVPMVYIYLYAIYLVFVNKTHDFYFWMLLMLTVMLSFALFSSLMLTNRIILIMPLFIAANVCSILKNSRAMNKRLYMLSLIGSVVVCLHLYAYRTAFSLL